jgi:flagellar basal-body rod protein FlgB
MQKIITIIYAILYMFSATSFANAQTIHSLTEHMKYLSAREMILSQNLANVDTPDYKPKDLATNSHKYHSLKMLVTEPGHMQTSTPANYDLIQGEILEIKPNGNAITPEHELMKKNENSIKFNEISNIYNKSRQMMKTAINGGGK